MHDGPRVVELVRAGFSQRLSFLRTLVRRKFKYFPKKQMLLVCCRAVGARTESDGRRLLMFVESDDTFGHKKTCQMYSIMCKGKRR